MALEVETHTQPSGLSDTLGRVGFYCWGGPGTVRMIETKYFNPRIDINSHMTCYDYDYIARVKDLFDVTDFWVSYSWGFSDATEARDRQFIINRLENFKKLGIRVHAYIQGPNLVYHDFPGQDWWARDEQGRIITYYRGRWQCSIHSEEFIDYVAGKIEGLYGVGFDGVFIDNMQQGQLGIPMPKGQLPFVFAGDRSRFARKAFHAETGQDIPVDLEADPALTWEYMDFRLRSTTQFIQRLVETAHAGDLEFGANLYDPKFEPESVYAIDMQTVPKLLDYVLFENHMLPETDGSRHNQYIEDIIDSHDWDTPVFLVSYRDGVGMAPQFSQEDLDNLFSEAANANFNLCLKGSEFTTKRVWHCMRLENVRRPQINKTLHRKPLQVRHESLMPLFQFKLLRQIAKKYYNPIFTITFEWAVMRIMLYIAYTTTIK